MLKKTQLLLNDGDKKINDKSINTYNQRLDYVRKRLKFPEDTPLKKIVEDSKKVIEIIENSEMKIKTRKLTYIVLSMVSRKLKLEEQEKEYNERVNYYKTIDNFERRENKVSENRKDNWTDWKTIVSVFDMIDEKKGFNNCQDKLIVGLYTRLNYVLRLDFANVRVIEGKPNKSRKFNHLLINNGTYIFYLKNYKTDKNFGDVIIKIEDEELKKLLGYWFSEYNYEKKYLLVSYKDNKKPLSENALSKRIPYIFNKYIGKAITNQIMREIKESDNIYGNKSYNDLSLNEKFEIHSKLLHSGFTGMEYGKKL